MVGYCSPSDLYSYGLPRGALASPGRVLDSASAVGDTLTLDGHGFVSGDVVQFRALDGGALPFPLVEGASYYAIAVDDWRFRVSATSGGDAVDLTTAGASFVVIAPLPVQARIDKHRRLIDEALSAHAISAIDEANPPEILRMTNAELAAQDLLALTGKQSSSLTALWDAAQKRLERWARGVPVRAADAPVSAQLASYAAVAVSPWRRFGGIG